MFRLPVDCYLNFNNNQLFVYAITLDWKPGKTETFVKPILNFKQKTFILSTQSFLSDISLVNGSKCYANSITAQTLSHLLCSMRKIHISLKNSVA